jgi:antitoxin PrlF
MGQNLTISKKGQITLPADLRKRLGLEAGDTVIAEERNGELVLRPSAVLEVEIYSEEDIASWDEEDRLDDQTRQKIVEKLESKS